MREIFITGGVVLTMDGARGRAEALLVRGNRIMAVGDEGMVRGRVTSGADMIDIRGKTIMPGFNDAHAHLQDAGRAIAMANLAGLNKAQIVECVFELDRDLPPGRILLASDWDYPACPDPHLSDLDSVVPNRPVYLIQHSGHAAWVNSASLRMLGIDRSTPEWDGGGPDRDDLGNLTGVLREPGQWPALRKLWLKVIRDKAAIRENLDRILSELPKLGITSVQDNTWFPWNLDALARTYHEGRLTARISCWSFGDIPPIELWMRLKHFNTDWYSRGPRKFQLDGAFSSHTAWLSEPYNDRPDTEGSGVATDKLLQRVVRATTQGRQLACHSIGDASTRSYIAAVETAAETSPVRALRHRIEHGQLVDRHDIERAVALGMVFSGQPFAAADYDKDVRLLGDGRASRAYPYRSILEAGAPLAFGSDYPGESTLNPFEAVHAAANRISPEAISIEDALSCYTAGSAYAQFKEQSIGKLLPGYLADMIVISHDPTRIEPSKTREIVVEATILDGELIYSNPGCVHLSALGS